MTQWNMVKWDTVLSIKNGKSQKNVVAEDGRYPIYGSGGVMGYANDFLCEENTVILGRKGSINSPIFVKEKLWNVDTAFGLVANKEFLTPKFLYYFCISYDFEKLNTTVTIPSLTKSNLLSVLMPLPPLDTQKQIIAQLELAQAMIDQRKQQLGLMDALIQSTFYEMFGDPVKNEKGWDVKPLNALISEKTQNGLYVPKEQYSTDGVAMVHMSDAFGGTVKTSGLKKVHISEKEQTQYRLLHTDLLLARRSLNYEGAAKPCRVPSSITDIVYESSLIRLRPNLSLIDTIYLYAYLNDDRARNNYLLQYVTKSTISGINNSSLNKVLIVCPPLPLQQQFAKRVEHIEALKQQMTACLAELEQNFNALMQQHFGG